MFLIKNTYIHVESLLHHMIYKDMKYMYTNVYRVKDQYTDKPVFGQLLLLNYTCYRTLGYTKIYIISVLICVPKTVTFASWLRPLQCFAYKCPTTDKLT